MGTVPTGGTAEVLAVVRQRSGPRNRLVIWNLIKAMVLSGKRGCEGIKLSELIALTF